MPCSRSQSGARALVYFSFCVHFFSIDPGHTHNRHFLTYFWQCQRMPCQITKESSRLLSAACPLPSHPELLQQIPTGFDQSSISRLRYNFDLCESHACAVPSTRQNGARNPHQQINDGIRLFVFFLSPTTGTLSPLFSEISRWKNEAGNGKRRTHRSVRLTCINESNYFGHFRVARRGKRKMANHSPSHPPAFDPQI